MTNPIEMHAGEPISPRELFHLETELDQVGLGGDAQGAVSDLVRRTHVGQTPVVTITSEQFSQIEKTGVCAKLDGKFMAFAYSEENGRGKLFLVSVQLKLRE